MLIDLHGADTDHRDIADAYTRLGRICILCEQHEQADHHLKTALDMYNRMYSGTEPKIEVAAVFREFGRNHFSKGDFKKALSHYHQELDIYRKIYTKVESSSNLGATLFQIGVCYQQLEDYEAAEQYSK